MYNRIQELKRLGKSIRSIAKDLKIDLKTVRKYYEMTEDAHKQMIAEASEREKIFDSYQKEIIEIYEINDYEQLNMCSIYDYLEEKYGILPGTEKSLRNYIRYLKEKGRICLDTKKRYYQQVEQLPFGRQAQLDFGERRQRNGMKLYIFAVVLSASRFKYIAFQEKPFKTLDVINHLCDCFFYFGGVPEELVIDQDKLMVVSENHGDIVFTKNFRQFIEEQELKMYVCRKADPETKGKVENQIKYIKQNFLQTRTFESIEEVNERALRWLERRANGKISQATKLVPAKVILEERRHLKEMKNSIFRKTTYPGREERTANDKAVISVSASRYQLPYKYKNRKVEIYESARNVFVFDPVTQQQIVDYEKPAIPGKLIGTTDFNRDKKIALENLIREINALFPWPLWQQFVASNLKAFPRYRRDQLMLARKYFQNRKKIDQIILKKAIEFCLSADTLSYKKLDDTYRSYSKMHYSSSHVVDLSIVEKLTKLNRPGIPIQMPSLDLYSTQISMKASGGNE
jgi:transposase